MYGRIDLHYVYGGFGTNWQQAKSVAVKAWLLSTAGVVITAALTGVFCHYALHIAWVESMLIGALIGSTDAASVSQCCDQTAESAL